MTGFFVLEACARAEAWTVSITESKHKALIDILPEEKIMEGEAESTHDAAPVALKDSANTKKHKRRYLPDGHVLRVHQRTYELSELCRIFLGSSLRNFFTLTTAGDLYGITWTFAAVFGSSLAGQVPMGTNYDYEAYVLMFMALTVPLSCMRISLQVNFQLLFLLARTVMLSLMLGTLIAAYAVGESHFGNQSQPALETPPAIFSNIVTVLQLCVFSTAYQFSVPGLTAETGDKGAMVQIIAKSVSYIFVTNLALSLLMALYFGSSTEASSNLNWLNYHGGTWDGEGEFSRAWWATGISYYIVLFAAFDGLAVYPLIAISLGDILLGALFEEKVHEVQENWRFRISFRLIASIPQAIGAVFVKDLGVIAKYAGIFTLLSYTICPSLLAIKSRYISGASELPVDTSYTTWLSSDMCAWILIVFASCLIGGVLVEAIHGW